MRLQINNNQISQITILRRRKIHINLTIFLHMVQEVLICVFHLFTLQMKGE